MAANRWRRIYISFRLLERFVTGLEAAEDGGLRPLKAG